MKPRLFLIIFASIIVISACTGSKYSAGTVLPGKWQGVSKKGKIISLEFKNNQEVVLIHDRLKLRSIKGRQKVMYELNQSVLPHRIKLVIYQYYAQKAEPRILGMIYKILASDTILIAIGNEIEEYPESFEQVAQKDKTILIKQPVNR